VGAYQISIEKKEFIKELNDDHPEGTLIRLLNCNCPFNLIHRGAIGKVLFVDPAGCLQVDFGSEVVPLNYEHGDRWEII
jgi:hypothetical protein